MGKEEEECWSTQLIDGNGEFNVTGIQNFMKRAKFAKCGLSYAVVSIMGPEFSGKSTLLNHLFHTNFKEMDAFTGRSQTTKGVWIAKCVGIEPCTLVMDLEGTEARDRREDDTFEKQTALFALAISDIVLINMWCHDIGREHASNKPLLKTVFQVLMRLFSPRRTTLLFVIRDQTKTPLENLEFIVREDIQKIWDGISKPQLYKDSPLSDFFNVEVTALSSYEVEENKFKQQVAQLRERFFHSIAPGGIAGDRLGVVPASEFSFSAQQIWKVTRENKDLEIPPYKVMVATVRCEEIADEKFSQLASDECLLALAEDVQMGPVSGFGEKLGSILNAHLFEYDMETIYFDEGVRNLKRQQLESTTLHLVYPVYQTILGHLCAKVLDKFKHSMGESFINKEGFAAYVRICSGSAMLEFDQGCADAGLKQANWDASEIREKLCRDIEFHAASVCSAKLSEIMASYEKQLSKALVEPLKSLFEAYLFEADRKDIWASIRKLLRREVERFSTDLDGFELDQSTFDNMVKNLMNFARSEVEKKIGETESMLIHMKDSDGQMHVYPRECSCISWIMKYL